MITMENIVPNNVPFLLPGGSTGCLLLHGFTSMPEEMRPLGEYLATQGLTVLGARLAGHATDPDDLKQTRWTDWLANVENGLAILIKTCNKQVLIGQSLGGVIALTAAASMEVSAVVALSTPYGVPPGERIADWLTRLIFPTIRKKVPRYPPDHPLYRRRELNYPAYSEFPSSILTQLDQVARAMVSDLPKVKVPVLLIHSKSDHDVPFANLQAIYDHLGSQHKERLVVDGMDHSLVMDPKREVVFEAIANFVKMIGEEG